MVSAILHCSRHPLISCPIESLNAICWNKWRWINECAVCAFSLQTEPNGYTAWKLKYHYLLSLHQTPLIKETNNCNRAQANQRHSYHWNLKQVLRTLSLSLTFPLQSSFVPVSPTFLLPHMSKVIFMYDKSSQTCRRTLILDHQLLTRIFNLLM